MPLKGPDFPIPGHGRSGNVTVGRVRRERWQNDPARLDQEKGAKVLSTLKHRVIMVPRRCVHRESARGRGRSSSLPRRMSSTASGLGAVNAVAAAADMPVVGVPLQNQQPHVAPVSDRAHGRGRRCGFDDTAGTIQHHVAQFSTFKPGTASRSESSLTTVHWLSVSAMAATCMSTCCMVRPARRSCAESRPYSSAASRV